LEVFFYCSGWDPATIPEPPAGQRRSTFSTKKILPPIDKALYKPPNIHIFPLLAMYGMQIYEKHTLFDSQIINIRLTLFEQNGTPLNKGSKNKFYILLYWHPLCIAEYCKLFNNLDAGG